MTDEWADLRHRHVRALPRDADGKGVASAAFDVCGADDEVWPCDVSRLLTERDRLAEDVAALRAASTELTDALSALMGTFAFYVGDDARTLSSKGPEMRRLSAALASARALLAQSEAGR